MTTLIKLTGPIFPPGFCWQNEQQYSDALFNGATAEFQSDIGNSFFNYGDTTPTADNRIYSWLKTVGGSPLRWYIFDPNYSLWTSLYRSPAGPTAERMAWFGPVADLQTYDEGVNVGVTPVTGPFWEEDTQFAAMFPLTRGTLPSGAVVAPGTLGGEEKHLLTNGELPKVTSSFALQKDNATSSGSDTFYGPRPVPPYTQDVLSVSFGNDEPHNNMPPYFGMVWAKRTARLYYTSAP